MSASLRERIIKVLTEVAPDIDPRQLAPDISLRDQTDFDSMDTLNFAVGLKREFGIDVPDADLRELASLESCMKYLQARLPAVPPHAAGLSEMERNAAGESSARQGSGRPEPRR